MTRLDATIAELRGAGRPVYDLGIGDPLEPTPPFILEALRVAVPAVSRYPRVAGTPALRAAVAGYLQRRFQVVVDPEREVLPSAGSKEAIFHLPLLLVDADARPEGPQDQRPAVLYPNPGYPIYERGATLAGAEAVGLPLSEAGGWLADLGAVPTSLWQRTVIFWLNSPHNPTGAVAPRAYLEKLAALSARHGFVIASDECYADLYFDTPPPSVLEVTRQRTIAFHSLSKRSGMTGIRSGFMCGDPALIDALRRFRPTLGTASPDFVQAAAAAAWNDDAHVDQRRQIFAGKRALFLALFEGLGLQAIGDAGIYLWVRLSEHYRGDDQRYALELARATGIVVQPGSFSGPGGAGYFRVALSPTVETCEEICGLWRRFEPLKSG